MPLSLPKPNPPKANTGPSTGSGTTGPPGPMGPPGPSTGPAGGDLTGSYPNPSIAPGAVTDAHVASANKDGSPLVPSLRTLGDSPKQAAPGNHTHPLPPSPSLHLNPDFEIGSGATPDNWFKYFEVGSCPWATDLTQSVSGTRSLRMDIPATANAQLVVNGTTFATTPGAIVTLSMWAMSNNDLGVASIGLITSDAGNTNSALYETTSINCGTQWAPMRGSFVVKAGHTKATPYLRGGSTPDGVSSVWFDNTSSSQVSVPLGSVIVGSVVMWASSVTPSGYLVCDGSTFDSGTYPDLAAVLGDTWGVHSGTTYFLPDLRARVPIGAGTGKAFATTDGVAEASRNARWAHAHGHASSASMGGAITDADTNHTHTVSPSAADPSPLQPGTAAGAIVRNANYGGHAHGGNVSVPDQAKGSAHTHAHTLTVTPSVTSGGPNDHPYAVLTFIIKAS